MPEECSPPLLTAARQGQRVEWGGVLSRDLPVPETVSRRNFSLEAASNSGQSSSHTLNDCHTTMSTTINPEQPVLCCKSADLSDTTGQSSGELGFYGEDRHLQSFQG